MVYLPTSLTSISICTPTHPPTDAGLIHALVVVVLYFVPKLSQWSHCVNSAPFHRLNLRPLLTTVSVWRQLVASINKHHFGLFTLCMPQSKDRRCPSVALQEDHEHLERGARSGISTL